MKIIRITVWKVPLTSHETYNMAGGKTCDTVDSIVVALDSDTGLRGWGEVCPIPHYLPAYADGVLPAIGEMAPVILGADPVGPEAVGAKMDRWLPGHVYAKSPIDMALWDLTATAAGLPLYALLGGRRSDRLPLYHSITCVAPDEMVRMAKVAYQSGIRQFQVKLGADDDWQNDVERLVKVREAVGDGPLVYGDWNTGATRLDATRVGRAIAHLDIMLEQPCATIEDCTAVKQATGLPMKMDENAHDIESLIKAYDAGCMDAVAIKLSKFGGLSKCRLARDLCLHFGARMCVEDTWGSDITTSALLHLGASTDPSMLMNVCDLSEYVSPRIDASAPVREDGTIAPPEGVGLGVEPDMNVLGEPIAVLEQE